MEGLIDLNIVLPALVTNCSYLLSSAVPPHYIIEWRSSGKCPTEAEIDVFWRSFIPPKIKSIEERIAALEEKVK